MSEPLTFQIIRDEVELDGTRDDWTRLYECGDYHYTQSFEWCMTAWRIVASQRGYRLCCIVGKNRGRTLLIWPLVVGRQGPWIIARPLGQQTTEYSDILIEPMRNAGDDIRKAWQFLRQCGPCDVVRLPCVENHGRLCESTSGICDEHAGWSCREVLLTSYIDWKDARSWKDYYQSLDRKQRRDIARRRRRLLETGSVIFESAIPPEDVPFVIDWVRANKTSALQDHGRPRKAWFVASDYWQLLKALGSQRREEDGVIVSALKVNGRLIAAAISRVRKDHLEAVITAFDQEAKAFSPSHCLYEELFEWSFGRSLAVDLRFGDDAFKAYWNARPTFAINFDLALTMKGLVFVALRRLRSRKSRKVPYDRFLLSTAPARAA
ncbi:MAG TPA: GNAT family N-acetyltransferase [Xanthobacteraceae bacterium]|nr:GNAT family N-acetyltransferase [Xanthobacteraceae bacterium]